MSRIADYLFSIALTVWVGALIAAGYICAPVLFQQIADKSVAGDIAGRLFTIVGWLGLLCAAYLLVYFLAKEGVSALKTPSFWLTIAMMLLTIAGQFGIQPVLAHLRAQSFSREVMEGFVRDRFVTWHGIANVLYLVQTALGLALVTQTYARKS